MLKVLESVGLLDVLFNYFGHRNWVILLTELTIIFKEFLRLTDVSNVSPSSERIKELWVVCSVSRKR